MGLDYLHRKARPIIPIYVSLNFNRRESLSIPDTSIILEGNKAYVYKISKDNIADRAEIKIGLRNNGNVEVISGLSSNFEF